MATVEVETGKDWIMEHIIHRSQPTNIPEEDLIKDMASGSSETGAAASDQLVERWLPLAVKLADRSVKKGQTNPTVNFEDAFQTAALALVISTRKVDPQRGKFSTIAHPRMVAEINRNFQNNVSSLRIPLEIQGLVPHVEEYLALAIQQGLSRKPEIIADWIYKKRIEWAEKVAADKSERSGKKVEPKTPTSISAEQVKGAMMSMNLQRISLSVSQEGDGDDCNFDEVVDDPDVLTPEGSLETTEKNRVLLEALRRLLPPLWVDCLESVHLRAGVTTDEVARKHGLTAKNVRTLANRAIFKLKKNPQTEDVLLNR